MKIYVKSDTNTDSHYTPYVIGGVPLSLEELIRIARETSDTATLRNLANMYLYDYEPSKNSTYTKDVELPGIIIRNNNCPEDILRDIYNKCKNLDYSSSIDFWIMEALVNSGNTPIDILQELKDYAGGKYNSAIAVNPKLLSHSEAALEDLDTAQLRKLAERTNNLEVLEILAFYPDYKVKENVIRNNAVTPEILDGILHADPQHSELFNIARSSKTSGENLKYIFDTYPNDRYVIEALAANVNTPPEVLSKLSKSRYIGTKMNAYLNPNTPRRDRERLAGMYAIRNNREYKPLDEE